MEENTYKVRKDTVKNIAIVFLSVMLVLTFFSNSILNRALPEVATEYVAYDSITERVRGTGTVTAEDPYKVMVKDSHTIDSVAVREGDMVMKDQVLFYLQDEESGEVKEKEAEVKAKEEERNSKVLEYMTSVLDSGISNAAFFNIQNGNVETVTAYQAKIEAARQKVQDAKNTVDSLDRQLKIAETGTGDDTDKARDLAEAETELQSAEERKTAAQENVNKINEEIKTLEGEDISGQATSAAMTLAQKKDAYDKKQAELVAVLKGTEGGEEFPALTDEEIKVYFAETSDPLTNLLPMQDKIDELSQKALERGGEEELSALNEAYAEYITANTAKEQADEKVKRYEKLKKKLPSAKQTLTNATNEYNAWLEKIEDLKDDSADAAEDKEEWVASLNISLNDANKALKAAEDEQSQLIYDIGKELSLSDMNSEIADIEEELADLEEELAEIQAQSTGATVVSPVEGTIISVEKTAGETTSPDEEVALIQVAGKGMHVSFSVTNDQAAKVKVGDKAELQNSWYYEDVMVTLSKIKPDTEDPGKRKLLEFTVEGSVQNGETLALTVGERSAEYDLVVPNSAVREDNNGKFVLIIEEKSTPFGNRYKAKRVDVEVMASDETKTAISGDLEGYEYVITTSNQPLQAGDQVRLAGY